MKHSYMDLNPPHFDSVFSKVIRKRFRDETRETRKIISAPPLTDHYSLVGQAFDYLLRFYVKHLNPGAISHSWPVEYTLRLNRDHVNFSGWFPEYSIAKEFLSEAKQAYRRYLSTGRLSDELLVSSLRLAKLDVGFFSASSIEIDQKDLIDLRNLIQLVNPEMFRAKKIAVLAPVPKGSTDFIGRVDLMIDNKLIDIKTTKSLHLTKRYLKQLMGAYLLFKRAGIMGLKSRFPINSCAIYYSRYGYMHSIEIADLIPK